MQLTRKIAGPRGGCDDSTCPTVWETDEPGVVAVQGTTLTGAELTGAGTIPGHESIVAVPRELLAGLAGEEAGR